MENNKLFAFISYNHRDVKWNQLSLIFVAFFFFLSLLPLSAQVNQPGQLVEYDGNLTKKALRTSIDIIVNGASSTISDSETGKFTLSFATRHLGDRLEFQEMPEVRGFELFNRNLLENWNINPKSSLNILYCKKSVFRSIVENYYSQGSKSYALQKEKAERRLQKALDDNTIIRKEYDRKIAELEEFYDLQMKNLQNYADQFARIDLTELSKQEKVIIQLIGEGRIEEAIDAYEDLHLADKVTVLSQNISERDNAIDILTKDNDGDFLKLDSVINSIMNQVAAYYLVGGMEYHEKARTTLLELSSVFSDYPLLSVAIGDNYRKVNKIPEAEVWYNNALQLNKNARRKINEIAVLDTLGTMLMKEYHELLMRSEDNTETALSVLQRCDTVYSRIYNNSLTNNSNEEIPLIHRLKYAVTLYNQHRYQDVVDILEQTLDKIEDEACIASSDSILYQYSLRCLGFAYEKLGDKDRALKYRLISSYIETTYEQPYYPNPIKELEVESCYLDDYISQGDNILYTLFLALDYNQLNTYHYFDGLRRLRQDDCRKAYRLIQAEIVKGNHWLQLYEAKGILQLLANDKYEAYKTCKEIIAIAPETTRLTDYEERLEEGCFGQISMVVEYHYPYLNKKQDYEIFSSNNVCDRTCNVTSPHYKHIIEEKGKFGFRYSNGKVIAKCKYTFVEPFDSCFAIVYIGNRCGVIDTLGREVIKCEYDRIAPDPVYKDCFVVQKNGKYGLAYGSYKHIKTDFDEIKNDNIDEFYLHDTGSTLYALAKKGNSYYVIDENNEIIVPIACDSIGHFWCSKPSLLYAELDGKKGIIDVDERKVSVPFIYSQFNSENYNWMGTTYDGRVSGFLPDATNLFMAVQKDRKWGFINEKGEVVIDYIYDNVSDFYHAHLKVLALVSRNGQWGAIDEKGECVIPIEYDSIITRSHKSCEVLICTSKKGIVLINEKGATLSPHVYDKIGDSFGFWFYFMKRDEKWFLLDDQFKEFGDYGYDDYYIYDYDKAEVKIDGNWYQLDSNGLLNIMPNGAQ